MFAPGSNTSFILTSVGAESDMGQRKEKDG
jgi:hypothetical protein